VNGVVDFQDVDRLCVEAGSGEAFSVACIACAVPLAKARRVSMGNDPNEHKALIDDLHDVVRAGAIDHRPRPRSVEATLPRIPDAWKRAQRGSRWSTSGQGADRIRRYQTELLIHVQCALSCELAGQGVATVFLTRKRSEVQIL